jgi:peroxiredoxin
VVNALDDASVERLAGFGIRLDAWSKRRHHTIAIPSQFLIGSDRKIHWAHAAHDHRTRPSVDQGLGALAKLAAP